MSHKPNKTSLAPDTQTFFNDLNKVVKFITDTHSHYTSSHSSWWVASPTGGTPKVLVVGFTHPSFSRPVYFIFKGDENYPLAAGSSFTRTGYASLMFRNYITDTVIREVDFKDQVEFFDAVRSYLAAEGDLSA